MCSDQLNKLCSFVPSCLVIRGHWNRHRSVRYLWLPASAQW